MSDAIIFAAVRKIVRRHSGNPLEGLVQLDVDELNAALKEARTAPPEGQGPGTAGNTGSATGGHPDDPEGPIEAGGLGAVLHTGLSDAKAFFDSLRQSLGGLSTEQVRGIEDNLLPAMGAAQWPLAFTAYGLATPWLETDKTMQPVHEKGGDAYFHRKYDITGNPDKARELGNLSPGDGVKYAGRGYVQLTGKSNYRKAEAALGVPLVANPDLAMKADVAARILVWGMEGGSFTGKKLAHYLPQHGAADRAAFKQARRIINGQDKADEIAGIALSFQRALQDGGWL
jgi:putative chitinase